MTLNGQTRDPICLERNVSKTAGFSDSVPKDHQQKMAYGLSNSLSVSVCCEAVRSAIIATAWLLVSNDNCSKGFQKQRQTLDYMLCQKNLSNMFVIVNLKIASNFTKFVMCSYS